MNLRKPVCGALECVCCLERVGARPGQGVTSMFKFGENFGFIQGLLTACSIPYGLVTPQKWKREKGGICWGRRACRGDADGPDGSGVEKGGRA